MKVVFHVDEMGKWQEATNNIRNLLHLEEKAEVVLLVNGSGIQSYQLKYAQKFIRENPNISFHACHNALKAFQMDEADLPASVKIVPAGVLDLIALQAAGYVYIKP
ncbi:DsrE family protein [Enterococcus dispar]|uniref:DsrE family protein n=1 Tax=Enterococcus dispar TaxID=44009 RepID=UPI0021D42ABB|nr:DsrE family protein [Enterococcus dispar]MCU7356637.1 DsrE family protein [Enterococcus dispar]MDT2704384.1 DsrE family protein [Enterococcus dispar]